MNTPKLGDSLLKPDGTPWMNVLARQAPKISWDDLTQTAALPLGSWLKTDPWDDKVHMLNAKRYLPMNPRDKMPLEVTPIFFKLQRYDASKLAAPAAPAADNNAAPPADQTAPAGQATNASAVQVPVAEAQPQATAEPQPTPPASAQQ